METVPEGRKLWLATLGKNPPAPPPPSFHAPGLGDTDAQPDFTSSGGTVRKGLNLLKLVSPFVIG